MPGPVAYAGRAGGDTQLRAAELESVPLRLRAEAVRMLRRRRRRRLAGNPIAASHVDRAVRKDYVAVPGTKTSKGLRVGCLPPLVALKAFPSYPL